MASTARVCYIFEENSKSNTMQLDFFETAKPYNAPPSLTLLEHASSNYAPRTGENARSAHVTLAFAVDFETAGERLTRRLAGRRYLGIPFGTPVETAANVVSSFMASTYASTLNIAGNGIYTLAKAGVSQAQADEWVYRVLRLVHAHRPIAALRSGGQSGIDTAGLAAAVAPEIPATGLYPKGFRVRQADGKDVLADKCALERELQQAAASLRQLNLEDVPTR